MKNKKKIILIIVLLIMLIGLGILIFILTEDLRLPKEEKIVNELNSMGGQIYIEYYYPSILSGKNLDEVKEYLKDFETTGLKFNLTELEKYSDEFKESVSNFKNGDKKCDKSNTMVIIYPKSPYGKSDFTIGVKLDCGFKDTEE